MTTRLMRLTAIAIALCSAELTVAKADDAAQLKIKLMQTTTVNAVMELSVPADKFVSDGNPDTLEIVFMSKPEDGPSHVSDDGEVIFLSPSVTDAEQSALIGKAFDIRVQRRLAGKP
jgi:hypothetical protein